MIRELHDPWRVFVRLPSAFLHETLHHLSAICVR